MKTLKIKIPISLAQSIQQRYVDATGESANHLAINAIEFRVTRTTGPELDDKPRTFTASIPAEIASLLDADRAAGKPSSEIIVAALAQHYGISLPTPELMTEFKIVISPALQKKLDRAVKLAKISRPEFIRRALAEAVKDAK